VREPLRQVNHQDRAGSSRDTPAAGVSYRTGTIFLTAPSYVRT
jgi:hypothetical protein